MNLKRTLILSLIFLFSEAYACTPDACLATGHYQDTLILGEVISVSSVDAKVRVFYVYPQNKLAKIKSDKVILVNNHFFLIANSDTGLLLNKKYLFSLNKIESGYQSKWGIYEVIGRHYSKMRLAHKGGFSSEELEAFIRSGGNKK